VGDFSDDNRLGIDHSLHRISAIRNRMMQIIGLTCRVGRALSGSSGKLYRILYELAAFFRWVIFQMTTDRVSIIRCIASAPLGIVRCK